MSGSIGWIMFAFIVYLAVMILIELYILRKITVWRIIFWEEGSLAVYFREAAQIHNPRK